MAQPDIEVSFVAAFWSCAQSASLQEQAWQAMSRVSSADLIEHGGARTAYAVLLDRFAAGKPLDDAEAYRLVERAAGSIAADLVTAGADPHLLRYAEQILTSARARDQASLLRDAAEQAARVVRATDQSAQRIAADVSTRLLTLFSDSDAVSTARSWGEHLDAELADMERKRPSGITLPWPKLNDACGPWVPGELIGLSAYSGGGKSTVATNLVAGLVRRGVPVIAFPTEMRRQWITRLLAAEASIPHRIAEKRQWHQLTPEQHATYRRTVAEARGWPMVVVDRGTITPAEIVAAARVLRQRWIGETVVVVIDHAHRLDYGREKTEEAVGRAAKLLKNFAGDDPHGGMIVLCLFQPRKPEVGGDTHRPVAGYQIRGDSAVWNELDVHLSPYRAWVEVLDHAETPWGTPAAKHDPLRGAPKLAKPSKTPEADGVKLDDEHVYLKVDKDRIGGEGPTLWLHYDKPSGRIYERWNVEATHAA